ncbi:MAG: hypothetical protein GY862_06670 [Gammaproteobacteria bacterium]|nr:hypothetical protein [Gammaproteobacteria bacterium]
MAKKNYVLQVLNYAMFMGIVGYFSASPTYRHLAPEQAVITLAFGHAGQPVRECRRRTPEELAKLPPNMRNPMDCPRKRSPLEVELRMDEQLMLQEVYPPAGLSGDGGVDVYRRMKVPAGRHRLSVRMKDSVRSEGFNYVQETDVDLAPAQKLVIEFKAESGAFIIK